MGKTREHKKKERVSAWEMYSDLFFEMMTKGTRHNAEVLGADKIQLGFDRIFSGRCTKAFFYVQSFPPQIQMSLMQDIREYIGLLGVRINFNVNLQQHIINWKSTSMKDNRTVWNQRLEEAAAAETEFLGTQKEANKTERDLWLVKSWSMVSEADRAKKAIIASDMIIEISTTDNSATAIENFTIACYKLAKYADNYGIKIKRVRGRMLDFLQYTSPVMDNTSSFSGNAIPDRVLIDEIVANMTPYTSGKLSQVGVYLGVDVETGMLVYMDFDHIMDEALNIMVAAGTSAGKSFMVKGIMRECSARGMNTIVLDRDGEYKLFTTKVGGTVIDLDRSSGKYFDSMQIGDLTGVEEIDSGLFMESMLTTTSVFNILISHDNGMNPTERKVFNDAYNLLLESAGVKKDKRETWINSSKLRYSMIYKEIVKLSENSAYKTRYGNAVADLADKLSVYFDKNGIRSHLFQQKISINDILHKVRYDQAMMLDICLYLDKDVDKTVEGKVEQAMKLMTTSYLTILLTNYFRSIGMATIIFLEEYQRYINCDEMKSLALNLFTSNRKRNAGTVVITNSPMDIIDSDESSARALTGNIQNLIIGKIEDAGTIHQICETWQIPHCEQALMDINSKPEYKHCFLVRFKNKEVAVVKHIIPDELAHDPMFSTSEKIIAAQHKKE